MKLVVWCSQDTVKNLSEILINDEILDIWIIGKKVHVKNDILKNSSTCILLLDGNLDDMLLWCLENGFSRPRVLDFMHYGFYKILESQYQRLEKNNSLFFLDYYLLLKQVASSYENDNSVLQLCKGAFIGFLSECDCKKFWDM